MVIQLNLILATVVLSHACDRCIQSFMRNKKKKIHKFQWCQWLFYQLSLMINLYYLTSLSCTLSYIHAKFYFITCKFKAEIFIFLSHVTKWWHIYDLHIINVCLHELSQFKARGINVKKRAMLRLQRVSDGIYEVLRWTNTRNREMAWSQGHRLALLHLRKDEREVNFT